MLLDHSYTFSLLLYILPTLKKNSFGEGPLIDLSWPCTGSTLGGFGPKVNTNVRGHEYFILTKFGKYASSDSEVKADSLFSYIYMH